MSVMNLRPPSTIGLSPIRKRLSFHNNNNNNHYYASASNTSSGSNNQWKNKARRLRIAICLYFILCVSFSILLFTWTVNVRIDQNTTSTTISRGLKQTATFVKTTTSQRDSVSGSTSTTSNGSKDMIRNPFQRIDQSRKSMLQHIHNNNPAAAADSTKSTTTAKTDDKSASTTTTKMEEVLSPLKEDGKDHVSERMLVVEENTITPVMQEVPEHLRIPDDEPVVQIISTRFMQHQPLLVELGLARLELLKTICLPTLQQQTSQNFLWIIRVDPDLADPVKQGLLQAIQNATSSNSNDFHVVVLGSNDNPNGFRRELVETPDQGWTNNYVLLEHFHEAAQSRIVLETRLDADDGLHVLFVEMMQEEAVKFLDNNNNMMNHSSSISPNTRNWLVWCAGTHVEWQYGTPWEDLEKQQSVILLNGTALPIKPSSTRKHPEQSYEENNEKHPKLDSSYGSLLPGLTRGCITPGLTKGYGRDVAYEEVPEAQHHLLHWKMKQCKEDVDWRHCLVVWKVLVPCAIRGRTPTSAGMQFVLGKHSSYLSPEAEASLGLKENNLYDKQEMMWGSVTRRFGISMDSIRQLRDFLTNHMHGIAQENLEGQCTKGHSCKNSSHVILKELLQETAKNYNGSAATTTVS